MIVPKMRPNDTPAEEEQARPTEHEADLQETDVEAGVESVDTDLEASADAGLDAAEDADGTMDDVAVLQERIDELEALNRELTDRYTRLLAEFDNFRRRTRENEQAVRAVAAEALMTDLLPVLDHLHMAIAAAGDALSGPFGQGVNLIHQQLNEVLARHGLQPVATVGQPFDPNTMEAIARAEPTDDVPDGHVIEEFRRGYQLNGKLLRASQVKVAQAQ